MTRISPVTGKTAPRSWRRLTAAAVLLAAAAGTPGLASPAPKQERWARMAAATVTVQAGAVRGTGVVISADGVVLTAAHVAGFPGQRCWVGLADGRECQATVTDVDRTADAAVLRIDGAVELPAAPLRRGPVPAGCPVIAIVFRGGAVVGCPGRVVVRPLGMLALPAAAVTDLSLIPGDSGGPLFDGEGRVVGLTVMSGSGEGRMYTLHCRTAASRQDRPERSGTPVPCPPVSAGTADRGRAGTAERQ